MKDSVLSKYSALDAWNAVEAFVLRGLLGLFESQQDSRPRFIRLKCGSWDLSNPESVMAAAID